ncbi:DUF2512 family protein [Brevibacillus dissolubilis]|uniref:DUF2512 family protein n=1 Tax=Brevibacillus dissolubilis TaxID=1844116 RepID=UPI002100684A|nr:DUF2512 family protein [Brevibacillus dissolubilis]
MFVINILLKLLANGIIAVPGLIWSGTSLAFAVGAAIALSLISYFIGDQLILPKTNNTFASTADFLLNFTLLWAMAAIFNQLYSLSGLFLTAFALSVVEYFYHDYLQRKGVHHSKHPG